LKKTVDIMVGESSMRDYPEEFEAPKDVMVWPDQKNNVAQNTPLSVVNLAPSLA
jgi:hypothetical protein